MMTAGWLPLMVWGTVLLGGSLAAELLDENSFWYWVLAIPGAVIMSAVVGYRSSYDVRIDTSPWLYFVVGGVMFIVGFGVWGIVDDATAALVWWVVIAGGMAVMSLLDKQHILALALGGITLWGVGLWALQREVEVLIPLVAALGAAMLAAGATLRMIRNEP